MIALGVVFFMLVRSLPRIEDNEEKKEKKSLFEKWLVSELPERADLFMSNLLAKWLRKIRVFILKMDNLLGNHLKKIAPKNGRAEGLGGFTDIVEREREE